MTYVPGSSPTPAQVQAYLSTITNPWIGTSSLSGNVTVVGANGGGPTLIVFDNFPGDSTVTTLLTALTAGGADGHGTGGPRRR